MTWLEVVIVVVLAYTGLGVVDLLCKRFARWFERRKWGK
jgi:hypothetical protein